MRNTATILVLFSCCFVHAQTPGDTLGMYFDAPGETLQLDSVYPAGCWQVGAPVKTVFTAAFSPGKALVTDTVLPYPENTTCYAEFKLIATDWNYLGRNIYWQQQRDMDSTAQGWLEFFDGGMLDWHRFSTGWDEWYQQGNPTWTDSGFVFTGASSGWEVVQAYSPCMGLVDGPEERTWEPELRVRFVFRSGQNPDARDGWMIDNVRAAVEMCSGGFQETDPLDITAAPLPAADRITLTGAAFADARTRITCLRADGSSVAVRSSLAANSATLDVSELPEGIYLVRVDIGGRTSVHRIVVAR